MLSTLSKQSPSGCTLWFWPLSTLSKQSPRGCTLWSWPLSTLSKQSPRGCTLWSWPLSTLSKQSPRGCTLWFWPLSTLSKQSPSGCTLRFWPLSTLSKQLPSGCTLWFWQPSVVCCVHRHLGNALFDSDLYRHCTNSYPADSLFHSDQCLSCVVYSTTMNVHCLVLSDPFIVQRGTLFGLTFHFWSIMCCTHALKIHCFILLAAQHDFKTRKIVPMVGKDNNILINESASTLSS